MLLAIIVLLSFSFLSLTSFTRDEIDNDKEEEVVGRMLSFTPITSFRTAVEEDIDSSHPLFSVIIVLFTSRDGMRREEEQDVNG
jgi:hypothetical protein